MPPRATPCPRPCPPWRRRPGAGSTSRDLAAAHVGADTVNAAAFRDAYAAYCRPTDGLDGVTLAPFQVLAAEGRALAVTESHTWHLDELAKLEGELVTPTRHRFVDLVVARGPRGGHRVVVGAHRRPAARAWSSSPRHLPRRAGRSPG